MWALVRRNAALAPVRPPSEVRLARTQYEARSKHNKMQPLTPGSEEISKKTPGQTFDHRIYANDFFEKYMVNHIIGKLDIPFINQTHLFFKFHVGVKLIIGLGCRNGAIDSPTPFLNAQYNQNTLYPNLRDAQRCVRENLIFRNLNTLWPNRIQVVDTASSPHLRKQMGLQITVLNIHPKYEPFHPPWSEMSSLWMLEALGEDHHDSMIATIVRPMVSIFVPHWDNGWQLRFTPPPETPPRLLLASPSSARRFRNWSALFLSALALSSGVKLAWEIKFASGISGRPSANSWKFAFRHHFWQ